MVKKEIHVSWAEFDDMAKQLVEKIKEMGRKFDGIHGIPRGGLILAVYLSHHLGLRLIENPANISLNTLIVDDISDNGDTLQKYKAHFIICLYVSLWTKMPPNIYLRIKQSPNDWIYFPWEHEDQETEKDNTEG